MYAGSGIFSTIYGSGTAFVAILAFVLIGRKISLMQWFGVFIIVFGLGIEGFYTDSNSVNVIFGSILIFSGVVMRSLAIVLYDYFQKYEKPPPLKVAGIVGQSGTISLLFIIIFRTLPRIDELFFDPIKENGANPSYVIVLFVVLFFWCCIHAASFFLLINDVGSTTTGVLRAAIAVIIFGVSGISFCEQDSNQCFTYPKMAASIFVFFGLIFYSTGKPKKKTNNVEVHAR
eukprot:TRINITY_DN3326_c5_g1_i1.p1 TRINITY_DN3326_c5_g1~~TRINITY_DN3326_c5_g1_i1.p1  ORF type:complete len:231 (+),score=40.95 TRINITY_DN3326_c5_g1_i1:184-876(+)